MKYVCDICDKKTDVITEVTHEKLESVFICDGCRNKYMRFNLIRESKGGVDNGIGQKM